MRRLHRRATVLASIAVLALAGSPAVAGAHGTPSPVVPVGQSAFGHSYAEWSARWWQWSYSLPTSHHPLFDTAACRAGQSGKVWFLGGTFTLIQQGGTVVGEAERACDVPEGKALFFPILNSEWDNVCPPTDPPLSVPKLRQAAADSLATTSGLLARIDGTKVANLVDFRVTSPVFAVTIPNNNIWKSFGGACAGTKAGTYSPVVADGWYLLLQPLSRGHHTIHFEGGITGFRLDITYHLEVD